ncbi:MAG: hypothetical protein C5B50_21240 [Verrucomicrobia bacterium]|nr:MAG: hypothetical protein C5B50_21240 [Verrucomicrobiota bacterium]
MIYPGLASLPDKQRAEILLLQEDDLSYEEISPFADFHSRDQESPSPRTAGLKRILQPYLQSGGGALD